MIKKLGFAIAKLGGRIWEKHGWNESEDYEDLPFLGKLGYQLFCEGLKMATGGSMEEIVNNYL